MAPTRNRVRAPQASPPDLPVAAMVVLLPLAAVLAAVPYVAPLLGATLEVDPLVEVVDHVVPAVVMAAAVLTALALRRHRAAGYIFAVAAALSVLAGLWATSTHVPLVGQARQGLVDWPTALVHTTPGVVVLAVALAVLVPALRTVD